MIWTFVFPLVLCMLCSLLAFQQMRIDRHLRRMVIDLSSFEGPARLELFGHTTHIGWVRQGPERIDVLTTETRKEHLTRELGETTEELETHNRALWQRIRLLREAITAAKDIIETWPSSCGENQPHAVANSLDAALETDGESDDIPF